MRPERWVGVLLLIPALAWAQGESKSEKQRRALEQRLGLPANAQPPVVIDAGVVEEVALPVAALDAGVAAKVAAPGWSDGAGALLEQTCAGCHRAGALAATSGWTLGNGDRADYDATVRLVTVAAPTQSTLLKKARGEASHLGGKVLAKESAGYAVLTRWIQGGAVFGRASTAVAVTTGRGGAAAVPPPMPVTAGAAVTNGTTAANGSTAASAPAAASGSAAASGPDAAAATTSAPLFAPSLHAALVASCSSCHSVGKMAAASRYRTSADAVEHAAAVTALIVPGSAERSLLYQRARGDGHPAGAVWPKGSPQLAQLAAWIDSGALTSTTTLVDAGTLDAGTLDPQPDAGIATSPNPLVAGAAAVVDAVVHANERGGLALGSYPVIGALRLNGRFDLNLERRNYTDNPLADGATNALQSYHHFLFLNRQSTEDNFTINVEVLSLLFWEVGYRISRDDWPVRLTAKIGKLIVPFGGESLHHSYGGLAGFDSKVLPAVFAQEGVSLSAETRVKQVAVTADVYMVSGYGLKRGDAVLNLQNDFAPLENLRPAFGGRIGASWGPISLFYSGLLNTLGHGRTLYMQAIDLAVWRPHGVPILQHFSFGAGVLRADVSGGGAGLDYYHLATYWQVRYYLFDWLYFQYRQGLRTFDNRRGTIIDDTRLTADDASAHNVSVVAKWRGISVGLSQFWNLEKVDEQPNDFTRLMVSYDF